MAFKRNRGYTLLEILVTVAVVSSIASGTYLVATRVTSASSSTRLGNDVQLLNQAIQVYKSHGGAIPAGAKGDEVLARLRREAANPRLPGLKGSLIDPRMTIRWQKSSEAASTGLRAYWDDAKQLFVLADSGESTGITEFYAGALPEPLPMVTGPNGTQIDPNLDDRSATKDFASVEKWVWDYTGARRHGDE